MQIDNTQTPAQQPEQTAPTKPKKLNPKQKRTIEYYFNPESETFSNLYLSALKAKFRPSYALNLANKKPLWLTETVESTSKLEQMHIIRGIEHLATKEIINSRSPDDTRLNSLIQLSKIAGLDQSNRGNTTNILVQPILNGQSIKEDTKVKADVTINPPTP